MAKLPQGMRVRAIRRKPGSNRHAPHDLVDALARQREEPRARADPAAGDVAREFPEERGPHRDRAHVAVALERDDAERLAGEVDRLRRQRRQFRRAHARLPEDAQDQAIARPAAGAEEQGDLLARQVLRKPGPRHARDRSRDESAFQFPGHV